MPHIVYCVRTRFTPCLTGYVQDIYDVWTIFRSAFQEWSVPTSLYAVLPRGSEAFSAPHPFLWPWPCWHYWLTVLPVAPVTELWSRPFIHCPPATSELEISSAHTLQHEVTRGSSAGQVDTQLGSFPAVRGLTLMLLFMAILQTKQKNQSCSDKRFC